MKIIKKLLIGVIALCTFSFLNVNASEVVISGNSVFRENDNKASINFISNGDGNVYYKVTSTIIKPSAVDIVSALDGGRITADTTKNILLTELTSGAKYVHILVKNEDIVSNILTIAMPYDIYYFDNFEAYKVDTYPSFFEIKYNGSGNAHQKIMNTTDKNQNQTKVFRLKGSSGWASDSRLYLSGEISDFAVMEIDMKFVSNDAGSVFFNQKNGAGSVRAIARIIATGGKIKLATGDSDGEDTGVTYSLNTWYNLKLVVDYTNRKFDVYLDNVKINNESMQTNESFILNSFGISSGNASGGNEIYTDNVRLYTTSSLNNSVTFETNGGSLIASQIIETGETAIEPSNPIKENYSFDGWYSDSNLTIPFDFNTPITKPIMLYAKWSIIQYSIAFEDVTGVIFDKTSPIIVNSGTNKDITITADLGYRLKSVKVNGVEKLPLSNNKVTLINITEDKEIVVTVEKIKYDVTNGEGQKHTIGTTSDATFRIDADKDLFLKVYLNDEELDSAFYTITEGSTVITLKQEFLNNLLPGEYNLKLLFTDGGQANTAFVVVQAKEGNPETKDSIKTSIIIASVSLFSIFSIGIYKNSKRYN